MPRRSQHATNAHNENRPLQGAVAPGECVAPLTGWRRGGDLNPRCHEGTRDFESRRLNQTPEPLRAPSISVCLRTVKLVIQIAHISSCAELFCSFRFSPDFANFGADTNLFPPTAGDRYGDGFEVG